jgi:hypothetical protein
MYKPCIIGHHKSNSNISKICKQQNKQNKMNVNTKSKSNSKSKVMRVVKKNNNSNNNKFKSKSTSHKCIKQKPPIVNCKRFIENPQKFFTEDLCDNVLNSYNLKHPITKSNTHTHTTNEQRSKRKTKSNNISPSKQLKTNISTTSLKPNTTKVIGNITLDIISTMNTNNSKRKHSI